MFRFSAVMDPTAFTLMKSPYICHSAGDTPLTETEDVTASTTICQGIRCLVHLVGEFRSDGGAKCVMLKVDNKSTISLDNAMVFGLHVASDEWHRLRSKDPEWPPMSCAVDVPKHTSIVRNPCTFCRDNFTPQ